VTVLPRTALRQNSQVYVIDQNNQLRFADVEVIKISRDEVYIAAGLERGDQVCVSVLDVASDGMTVRLATDDTPQASTISMDAGA
jgi:voltage-gated potassium channel Kch